MRCRPYVRRAAPCAAHGRRDMLHLLIDTSVWLDLAERRDGQRWIVPLRVLLFQKKLELMVPALVIDEFDRNRPRREDALTKSVVDRLRQFRRDLRSLVSPGGRAGRVGAARRCAAR